MLHTVPASTPAQNYTCASCFGLVLARWPLHAGQRRLFSSTVSLSSKSCHCLTGAGREMRRTPPGGSIFRASIATANSTLGILTIPLTRPTIKGSEKGKTFEADFGTCGLPHLHICSILQSFSCTSRKKGTGVGQGNFHAMLHPQKPIMQLRLLKTCQSVQQPRQALLTILSYRHLILIQSNE